MSATLADVAAANRDTLARALMLAQRIDKARHPRRFKISADSLLRRLSEEAEWEVTLQQISDDFFDTLTVDQAIVYASTSWTPAPMAKRVLGRFRKDAPPANDPPTHESVMQQLTTWLNSPEGLAVQQAVQMYVGRAQHTSEHAGQTALDHMGINKTFAWAHPRSMANDMFSVRGSKVVQQMYGDHIDKLTSIIIRATDPAHPQTLQEVKAIIKKEWPKVQQSAISRIARTETAAVWTSTSVNAYQANGISQFESIIAHGPTIGIESEDPCDECLDAAALIHDISDDDLPPWHPNCRCEAIPVLDDEEGTPWLPPDEPFTGEDIGMCGEGELASIEMARRTRLAKWRSVKVIKSVDGACLTPAPEPGGPYGGETYEASPPLTQDALALLIKQIQGWPDFAGSASQIEVKALAKKIASTDRRKFIARNANGEITGIADYDQGLYFAGYPETVFVRGIATKGGGARRVLSQIAREAYKGKKALAVDVKGVSPAMMKNLEKYGFKKHSSDAYIMERDALKPTFHISDAELLPEHTLPIHTPVAPATEFDMASLKAQLKGYNNRIAGHRKKLKMLQEKPYSEATQKEISKFEDKLATELQERDAIKQQIDSAGAPHAPATAPTVPHIAVPDPLPKPELPAVPEHPTFAPAPYGSMVETAPGKINAEALDAIREETIAWDGASDIEHFTTYAEENPDVAVGVLSLRDESGNLMGVVHWSEPETGMEKGFFSISDIVMKNPDNVEGIVRGITAATKYAVEHGPFTKVRMWAELPTTASESEALHGALVERGFTSQAMSKYYEADVTELKATDWLKAEEAPVTPAVHIEDTISVGEGTPITQEALAKIDSLGLDGWPPPKGSEALKQLKGARDTKEIFFDAEAKTWSAERREKVWNDIVNAHFDGKVPSPGEAKYRVEYTNPKSHKLVQTIEMSETDAQGLVDAVGAQGIPDAKLVQTQAKRTAYFTSGGGGAGKGGSSFVDALTGKDVTLDDLRVRDDIVHIDPDAIKEMIPEYKAMLESKDTYAAYGVHEESSDIARLIKEKAEAQGFSVIIDTTGSSERFISKMRDMNEAGYDVQVSMTTIDTNEAIMRTLSRGDRRGRYVPVKSVKKAHAGASQQMEQWVKEDFVKSWRVYDNSTSPRVLVAEGSGGKAPVVHDAALWKRVQEKANEIKVRKPAVGTQTEGEVTGLPTAQTGTGGIMAVATPEQLKANLYNVANKIAGHKKKIKALAAKGDHEQKKLFETKLEQDLLLRDDIKAKLKAQGFKPTAAKPAAAPKPAKPVPAAEKPVPSPKPGHEPAPDPVVTEPVAPAPAAAHQPDAKRVVPGGITKEKGTTALNKEMTAQNSRYGAVEIKRHIMKDISDRIAADPKWKNSDIRSAYGYSEQAYGEGGDNATVAQLVNNWAQSSSNADARAVAMQIAVAEEFGMDTRVFAASFWNDAEKSDEIVRQAHKLLDGSAWFEGGTYKEAGDQWVVKWEDRYQPRSKAFRTEDEAKIYRAHINSLAAQTDSRLTVTQEIERQSNGLSRVPIRESLRTFVRAQYDATQAFLKEQGVDEVTVYRGYRIPADKVGLGPGQTGWEPGLSTVNVTDNPIASWTVKHSVARSGSFYGGTMMRASAPREMIFSTSLTGFGCANEYEVLVMNYADNSAWVAQNGHIILSAEQKNIMNAKLSGLRTKQNAVQHELDKVMVDGQPPGYGTPERAIYYERQQEANVVKHQIGILERTLEDGTQNWSYEKEADLRAYIEEAVRENQALAGKEIKLRKPSVKAPATAEQIALRPYKSKITSIKRMISNRQKKVDNFLAAAEKLLNDAGYELPSNKEALMLMSHSDLSAIPGIGQVYNATRYINSARRYANSVRDLKSRLVTAEEKLAQVTQEYRSTGYTKAVRSLLERARG